MVLKIGERHDSCNRIKLSIMILEKVNEIANYLGLVSPGTFVQSY